MNSGRLSERMKESSSQRSNRLGKIFTTSLTGMDLSISIAVVIMVGLAYSTRDANKKRLTAWFMTAIGSMPLTVAIGRGTP